MFWLLLAIITIGLLAATSRPKTIRRVDQMWHDVREEIMVCPSEPECVCTS